MPGVLQRGCSHGRPSKSLYSEMLLNLNALHLGSEVLVVTLRCSALLASWGWKLSMQRVRLNLAQEITSCTVAQVGFMLMF